MKFLFIIVAFCIVYTNSSQIPVDPISKKSSFFVQLIFFRNPLRMIEFNFIEKSGSKLAKPHKDFSK